jgi:nucleotide-binding universal stress UspA family protein
MKDIMLFAHDDAGQEARLQCALDITRAVGGHLTCVDIARPPVMMADYYTTAGALVAEIDEKSNETKNALEIKARLEREDVPWNWIDADGDIAHSLRKYAGLADAVIVNCGKPSGTMPDLVEIAASVARGIHGCVVAVPEECDRFDVLGKAVIAWDGSQPVMAAMQCAVPLLQLAASVNIVTVDDGSKGYAAEEAASYLSRYGVHAKIIRIKDSLLAADEHILTQCETIEAAYCVMGCYGHSRLTSVLFGSVSRRMLLKSDIPLLIAH